MMTEDYILRMLQDMVRMALRLTGQKTETPYTPEQLLSLRAGDTPPLPPAASGAFGPGRDK